MSMTVEFRDRPAFEVSESPERRLGYMFGVGGFDDSPCFFDYDPWAHAEMLDVPIVFRDDLPSAEMVAAFSVEHQAIFVRPNLHVAVERCGLAHELVHFENNDVGTTDFQELRADRISARRLIRPSGLERLYGTTEDPAVVALELNVTEKVMRTYMRMRRNGHW